MLASNVSEEKIVWSGKDFKLSEFVEIYPPPQIVKVEEGYMDDTEEDRCLSSSQVLTLHKVEEVITVQAFSWKNQSISLPANSDANVEIISQPKFYENVAELARDRPTFVAAVEKHPWLDLNVNDVLQVDVVSESSKDSHLLCVNRTNGCNIELPLNYTARFKSLGNCPVNSPTMADIIEYCEFPIVVRYVDDRLKVVHEGFNADFPLGIDKLGPLTLNSVTANQVLLATPWGYDKVMPLPMNLEVHVVAAVGALQKDTTYSTLCAIAHNNTKPDDLRLKFIKEGEYKVLLEEKDSQSEDDEDDVAYCDVGPPVPSRNFKPNKRHKTRYDGGSDSQKYTTRPSRSKGSLEGFSTPEDVFEDCLNKKERHRAQLPSVKKVIYGFKRATKHGFKVLKWPAGPKTWKERDKNHVECHEGTPVELSHAPNYAASNVASHATKSHPTKGLLDLAYREIQPLPSNIRADRYNADFANLSTEKSSFHNCKIRNPNNKRTWTIEEVSECLRYCRLGDYVDRFREEMIDGVLLADLDEDSLKSLGVNNKLHILKMMKIIDEGWFPK